MQPTANLEFGEKIRQNDPLLWAGVSRCDISPPRGAELAGYPHFPRHNTGVHDPLTATCLTLRSGAAQVSVLALDLLFLSRRYVLEVRRRVSAITGAAPESLQIFCSHTHSGPWAAGRLDLEAIRAGIGVDAAWIEVLVGQLTDVVVRAQTNLQPAQWGWGVGRCGAEQGVGGNRHDPSGLADPSVHVLGVADLAGQPLACLVGYALHPTLLHADNTRVSADYPGYLRAAIETALPGCQALFAQGAAGDQSTRYFRQGQSFDEAERIGRAIGEEALRVIATLKWTRACPIRVLHEPYDLTLRDFPSRDQAEALVREAQARYDRLAASQAPYIDIQNANVFRLGAEDILGYVIAREEGLRIDLLEQEQPAELTALALGDFRLVGMPGEVFVRYGLAAKAGRAPGSVMFLSLLNGCLPGYVYSHEAAEHNAYEANTSMLHPDTGDQITARLRAMLAELDRAEPEARP